MHSFLSSATSSYTKPLYLINIMNEYLNSVIKQFEYYKRCVSHEKTNDQRID